MKIVIVQCEASLQPKELESLWKNLYEMGKAGVMVLPEYCKLVGTVGVDRDDS